LAQLSNLPREIRSTQVLVRFALRLAILMAFAAFGSIGFGRNLSALLWMSIIFSAIMGAIKREPAFGIALNYWDETVAYAALFALVSVFNQAAPA